MITFMMKIRGRAERLPGVAGGQLGIQHVESFSTRTAKPPGTRVALGLYRHGYLPTQPSYWLLISKIGYKTAVRPADARPVAVKFVQLYTILHIFYDSHF